MMSAVSWSIELKKGQKKEIQLPEGFLLLNLQLVSLGGAGNAVVKVHTQAIEGKELSSVICTLRDGLCDQFAMNLIFGHDAPTLFSYTGKANSVFLSGYFKCSLEADNNEYEAKTNMLQNVEEWGRACDQSDRRRYTLSGTRSNNHHVEASYTWYKHSKKREKTLYADRVQEQTDDLERAQVEFNAAIAANLKLSDPVEIEKENEERRAEQKADISAAVAEEVAKGVAEMMKLFSSNNKKVNNLLALLTAHLDL